MHISSWDVEADSEDDAVNRIFAVGGEELIHKPKTSRQADNDAVHSVTLEN